MRYIGSYLLLLYIETKALIQNMNSNIDYKNNAD